MSWHPNHPGHVPEPLCEWDAVGEECNELATNDEGLCERHMAEALEEDAADTARKMMKEDELD